MEYEIKQLLFDFPWFKEWENARSKEKRFLFPTLRFRRGVVYLHAAMRERMAA